jgi:hypothetical protein
MKIGIWLNDELLRPHQNSAWVETVVFSSWWTEVKELQVSLTSEIQGQRISGYNPFGTPSVTMKTGKKEVKILTRSNEKNSAYWNS